MKQSRFSEEQIVGVLKEREARVTVKEICRQHGICDQTYYRWISKFGGLEVVVCHWPGSVQSDQRRGAHPAGYSSRGGYVFSSRGSEPPASAAALIHENNVEEQGVCACLPSTPR